MIPLILVAALLFPLGSIVREMWRDEMRTRTARDIARILTPLAPSRDSLHPPEFDTYSLAWPEDFWDSHTGQFWTIVLGELDPFEPCTHCATPEDGELAHAGCPGCACPCSLVEVAA